MMPSHTYSSQRCCRNTMVRHTHTHHICILSTYHHVYDITGLVAWKALLPWEREEREAELGLLWEETQESDDMLSLSDLPGAFRIYR